MTASSQGYIATRLKKGYQLIAEVSFDTPQAEETIKPQSGLPQTISPLKWAMLVVVLALLVVWMGLTEVKDTPPTFTTFRPITSGLGAEQDPAFSPDGPLAGLQQTRGNSTTVDLAIYDVRQKTSHRLTDWPGDELAPIWSDDGSKLAYFYKQDGRCGLYVTAFSEVDKGHIAQGDKLADCGHNNQGQIAWVNDETLIYADRNIDTMGEHKLYRISLDGQYKKQIEGVYPLSFSLSADKSSWPCWFVATIPSN